MVKNNGIHALLLEHVDVLSLLYAVGYIVYRLFLRLLLFLWCTLRSSILCIRSICRFLNNRLALGALRLFYRCKQLRKCLVLIIDILKEDIIVHLVTELFILQAAVLDKRSDIVPVFLVGFLLCLAHADQLVCNLLGDVLLDLLDKSIVLQSRS